VPVEVNNSIFISLARQISLVVGMAKGLVARVHLLNSSFCKQKSHSFSVDFDKTIFLF